MPLRVALLVGSPSSHYVVWENAASSTQQDSLIVFSHSYEGRNKSCDCRGNGESTPQSKHVVAASLRSNGVARNTCCEVASLWGRESANFRAQTVRTNWRNEGKKESGKTERRHRSFDRTHVGCQQEQQHSHAQGSRATTMSRTTTTTTTTTSPSAATAPHQQRNINTSSNRKGSTLPFRILGQDPRKTNKRGTSARKPPGYLQLRQLNQVQTTEIQAPRVFRYGTVEAHQSSER